MAPLDGYTTIMTQGVVLTVLGVAIKDIEEKRKVLLYLEVIFAIDYEVTDV